MKSRELLPEREKGWLDAIAADPAALGLAEIERAAPAHAPIPWLPLATAQSRPYGLLLDPQRDAVWSGQIYKLRQYYGDSGYVGSEGVGLHGFLLHLYFEDQLGEAAARLIESLTGVPLPRKTPDGYGWDVRDAAYLAHGVSDPTSVLVAPRDFFRDPALVERIRKLAPSDGEIWVRILHRETRLGHVDAAVAALRELEKTWRHTWGYASFDLVPDAIKALGLSDDGTSRLVFEAYHPDFGERFQRAVALIGAKDWHGGTKWIHDLAYEQGDFHSVLPLLARGFKRMGWDWAVDLCTQRRPTDAEKAHWPFDMAEATKD